MHLFSKRRAVVGGVVVLALAGGTTWWFTRSEPAAAQSATMTVSRETFKTTVSASGTVEPAQQADLDFAVSGTVTRVLVHEGQKVRKGQALAVIDDSLLASDVTAKESALDAAETRLDDDEDDDASDTQLASDRAAIVNAETQMEQAKDALGNATLRSTIAGTVASVSLAKGDTVGNTAGSTETAQVTVVATKRFVVDAQVSTDDIKQVKRGLQVEVTPTGATDPVYGTVKTVGRVAVAQDSGAATFPVTVEITGKQKNVYAGASATVEIIVKQVDDVLAVPSMALRQDGDETYVYRLVDGKRVKTPVTTGTTYGASTEVTKGLSEGDVVEIVSFQRTPGTGTRNGNQGGTFQLPSGGDFQPPTGGFQGGPPTGAGQP